MAASTSTPRRRALPEVTLSEYRGVRSLHLGSPWIQGSMRISQPLKLELEYVRRMMACLLLLPPERWPAARAVQLGLGAASITKFCRRVLDMDTTAVELNPQVIETCRRHFHLGPDDERLRVVQDDAAHYVVQARHHGSADLLFVDLYDHEAASPVLDDVRFYEQCRQLLAPGGAMSVNLFGREARFGRSMKRLAQAFGDDRVAHLSPTPQGNAVALAWRDAALPERAVLLGRAGELERHCGLHAAAWVRYLRTTLP